MIYVVTIGADNKSESVLYAPTMPETLEAGQYAVDEADAVEGLQTSRWILDGGVCRQLTEEEITAELAAFETASADFQNRNKRGFLLAQCDWVVVKSSELGEAVPAEWATYRQALRDITTHANWPMLEEADWPVSP